MPVRRAPRPKVVQQAQTIQTSEGLAPTLDTPQLAHDLNNKVFIILSHCHLMKCSVDSENSRHLHAIRDAAQRIADIIQPSVQRQLR
jgi:hypothetical protein